MAKKRKVQRAMNIEADLMADIYAVAEEISSSFNAAVRVLLKEALAARALAARKYRSGKDGK